MTDPYDSIHVREEGASEGWTMAAEEYGYTSPFGGPPVEIEVYESAGTPGEQVGADLMGFLSDFRTGQREVCQPKPDVKTEPDASTAEAVRGLNRFEFNTKEADDWIDPYAGHQKPMGADWWQASDGKWYPGELHPDRQAPVASAAPVDAAPEPHPVDPASPATAGEPDDAAGRKRRFSFGR
jgi:hypothetical protein